jgi:putative hydrolase of the HAD superfamily
MQGIKNVIFDLGGVLLNIDYYKTANAFKALGAADFDSFYSQAGANELFELLETGNITNEDFYKAMQSHCQPGTSNQQMEDAWNAILLDFRPESLQFLTALKNRYNIYLLSNTNAIHHQAFHQSFTREIGLQNFDDYFVKSYYSHQIHQRKPYATTYNFVLQDAGIAAGETLFIDDSIVNIEGANQTGLLTHLLLPNERIELLEILK